MRESKHILVVDDEPLNLEIIAEHLDDPSYKLSLFESSEKAWQHLDEAGADSYDLILLDRMMPGMDGIQFLHTIKADPRFRHTPVVMQTAASGVEEVSEGIAAGAFYYLAKPYSSRELLAIVHSALTELTASPDEASAAIVTTGTDVYEFSTVAQARSLATQLAARCPHPELAAMGLGELLINAIEHGNLGISYREKKVLRLADTWEGELERRQADPKYAGRVARVTVQREPQQLVFTVTDCGEGFDWHSYLEISAERAYDPNGRGIAVARQLSFSRLEYRGCGNIAVATISLVPMQ
ncbi:MAG TPA: response regulator [Rhodocyclaceae bacterium]|nr:response regulator [Rhodocyclaceae bacterium]